MQDKAVNIDFNFEGVRPSLTKRKALRAFIAGIFKAEGLGLGLLSITFLTDKALLKMNRQHLQHDYFTDILTFNLSMDDKLIIGDIYISYDRVIDNAHQNDVSIQQELHRVIFHGILHLIGFMDNTPTQRKKIREKEDMYLAEYFVSRETKA